MEVKYCTYKKQIIEIEPENQPYFKGKKQVFKKVGYDWKSCSMGPCEECTRKNEILEDI